LPPLPQTPLPQSRRTSGLQTLARPDADTTIDALRPD